MNEKAFVLQVDKDQLTLLEEAVKAGKIRIASEAESSRFVLRALINYHERMTMATDHGLTIGKTDLNLPSPV